VSVTVAAPGRAPVRFATSRDAVSAPSSAFGSKHQRASTHFETALALRQPGYDRVKLMDRIGLAAALLDEGEAERGVQAAHQALDEAARVDSALVHARLNTLLAAARPYATAAMDEARTRAREVTRGQPATIAA
jgi:hypothetical protein